ncbi:MAG: foldase [Gammaproteobacteria bacterium RIFOXYA12_FULL_61_12]|nr:MAG: foldase [Gammaproteobacteria bacterium RIFOXYD12_FULL_61_37]OGT90006.1 MAG: foldase [Gammaproteobacteria bacterium RIFOXYA12_FULL_61_12]
MKLNRVLLAAAMTALFAAGPLLAKAQDPQILVTVGDLKITGDELDSVLASSPFATQFVTMGEKEQAALRGDMLQRLVASRLLRLEAQHLGLDRSETFTKDEEAQRAALLYRHYMDKLRERVSIPADTLAAMKQQFKGDADGLASAEAAYKTEQYRTVRLMTIQSLRDQQKIKLHEERIAQGITPETLLLEGTDIRISYGDVVDIKEYPNLPNPEWVKEQLYKRAELMLVAKTATDEGVDVSGRLLRYREERLPALLIEMKEKEWVSDEQQMRDWHSKHPEVSKIPERRHLGQLVVATREEAEALRGRILKGESLFELAGKYSIDEEGRKKLGDMGWVIEGRGYAQLEEVVAKLEDGKVSEVVETPKGFHLVSVLDRRPGGVRDFHAVKDRVRQLMIQEHLSLYLKELEQRHKVVWNLEDRK